MRPLPTAARLLLPLVIAVSSTSCAAAPDTTAGPTTAATTTPSPSPSVAAPQETPTAAAPAPAAPAPATDPTITIAGFEYAVARPVAPGEQVTVVNEDREAHTVTLDGGAVRLTVPGGGTAVFAAPDTAGDHPIVCDLHGGMEAVLVVA